MIGRPKIFRTPEELRKLHKERRKRYKKYFQNYGKMYYYQRLLADPNYNKKRKQREKQLKAKKP